MFYKDKLIELKLQGCSCDDCFYKDKYNKHTCLWGIRSIDAGYGYAFKLPTDNICIRWAWAKLKD